MACRLASPWFRPCNVQRVGRRQICVNRACRLFRDDLSCHGPAKYRNSDMETASVCRPLSSRGFSMRIAVVFGLALLAGSLAGASHADVKMSGTFVADAACPATQAIKN